MLSRYLHLRHLVTLWQKSHGHTTLGVFIPAFFTLSCYEYGWSSITKWLAGGEKQGDRQPAPVT